jgi:hypothetical protein
MTQQVASSSELTLAERVTDVVSDAKTIRGWDDSVLADTVETVLDAAHQRRLRTLYSSQRSPIHMFASVLSGKRIERHLETYALRDELDAANLQSFAETPDVDPLNIVALLSNIAVSSWETDYSRREIGMVDEGVHIAQQAIAHGG